MHFVYSSQLGYLFDISPSPLPSPSEYPLIVLATLRAEALSRLVERLRVLNNKPKMR